MMTAFFLFLFLMYTYMTTLFHFYHGSDVGPCEMRIYVGTVSGNEESGAAFFLASLARCCCAMMAGGGGILAPGPGKAPFYILRS